MRVVVPLAGPDFVREDGTLKANVKLDGEPLLRRVLNSRPWAKTIAPNDYSFVLFDTPETRTFAAEALSDWYPGATIFFMSTYTRGAALSSLIGTASGNDVKIPIIIDLADILYSSTIDPKSIFQANPECGGIALTFNSDNPQYSYLSLDDHGLFNNAVEKQIISENASTGTYIFRDLATYLRALAHNLDNEQRYTFQNLFYVCPLLNGVKSIGKKVILESVTNVIDIKMTK